MFGVPPKHFAIGNVHSDNLPLGIIALICQLKQLQEGLIVFSDNILHSLKIKKKFVEFTKTILWLSEEPFVKTFVILTSTN